jgi:hypothetical protein
LVGLSRVGADWIAKGVIMTDGKKSKGVHFTMFRSATEQADLKVIEKSRDPEGGHMSCTSGRIITVRGGGKPFKVIMSRQAGEKSEHLFATMREAEAFIRRNTPRPPERSTTYDHESENT